MRICYISSEYPPETGYGGIGTYTRYIAEGMAERGHSVTVISQSTSSESTYCNSQGVHLYRVPPVPYPLPQHRYAYYLRRCVTALFPHTLNRLCRAIAFRNKIRELSTLQKRPFDIIESAECGAESSCVPRSSGKKQVIRLHTPWEFIRILDSLHEPAGDLLALPFLEKRTTKRADAITAPSRAIALAVKKRWNLGHITIIPNPLPSHRFPPSNGNSWIYTGRIEKRKGVHHLITAYADVCREMPQVPRLKLIGKAYGTDRTGIDYGETVASLINSHHLPDKIHWIQGATPQEVTRYLQDAAAAFFPSLWENFPYACLEAMASGCAVVATNCGGFPEIIDHNRSGLLVPPGSSEALGSAMRYLLKNHAEGQRMGREARNHVMKTVSVATVCENMEHFYHRLQDPAK